MKSIDSGERQVLRRLVRRLGQDAQLENRRAIPGLLEKQESARVLDAGCGDGGFTRGMGQRLGTTGLC